MTYLPRSVVETAVAAYYSAKFGGSVYCEYDPDKRAYHIGGVGLPSHPDFGPGRTWTLGDHIPPAKAQAIARTTKPADEDRESRLVDLHLKGLATPAETEALAALRMRRALDPDSQNA